MATDPSTTSIEHEIADIPAIADALRNAFGSNSVEHMAPLGGGLSAAGLYKLSVGGRGYVLRQVRATSPAVDAQREFACMVIASELGIAPRLAYVDSKAGIVISDLIPGQTLVEFLRAGGGSDVIEAIGALVRKLHHGPAFPPLTLDAGKPVTIAGACRTLIETLSAGGASSDFLRESPKSLDLIENVLTPHRTIAPCHYDLNPGNILIDGNRVWLVDWELACAGDPFHDLVTLHVFAFRSPIARDRLIRAYLERAPTELEEARLVLSRALAFTFYALLFTGIARARAAEPKVLQNVGPDVFAFAKQLTADALAEVASAEFDRAVATLRT